LRLLLILLLLAGVGAIAMWLLQTPLDEPLTQPSSSQLFSPGSETEQDTQSSANAAAAATPTEAPPSDAARRNTAGASEKASTEGAQARAGTDADGEAAAARTGAEATQAPVLTLQFEEDSWLRVRNSEGRTVTNRLAEAGERARIADEPTPLELFVGYAPGTEARWRGEAVNFARATRSNNTALVTLE
ncbi:MAG: DUF4115 domain-containing protein, partial [Algiphilus sp.]